MQQKTQHLGFGRGATGEARSAPSRETEACAARGDVENRAAAGAGRGSDVERSNLKKALAQVRANKGAPGIDGMSVEDLVPHLKEHWPTIRAQLLDGSYKPQPVRRLGRDGWVDERIKTLPINPASGVGLDIGSCPSNLGTTE